MMTLAMLIGVAYGAGVADCAQTCAGPEVADPVVSAEETSGRLDATAFASARSAMEALLACASQNVPAGMAAIVGQIDSQTVVSTHYRWPDELGFAWVVKDAVAPSADVPTTRPTPRRWTQRSPAAAAASLAASGALLALAADSRAEFNAVPTLADGASGATREAYRTELEGAQARANGLTLGGYVAGGAAITLGVVAA